MHASIRALVATLLVGMAGWITADDEAQPSGKIAPTSAEPTTPRGVRRGLIICGLSGDGEHHRAFSATVDQLHKGLVNQVGLEPGNLKVLFGDEPDEKDSPLLRDSARSTKETIAAAIEQMRVESKPEDGVWIVLMGHAHFDGKDSWLNLPGPDVSQFQVAEMLNGFTAGEQVVLATIPVSGQWIKPLSKDGRVVITATEAGWETNETEFPAHLAQLFEKPIEGAEADIDQDGRLTLFDVYLATCRLVAQSYADRELLATEHSLLDDNGDGRGTELQIDYLPEELGGRVRRSRIARLPKIADGADGALARTILLKKAEPAAP